MNIPTFRIRDSGGEPSEHEAVHVVYVRELNAEKERLQDIIRRAAGQFCEEGSDGVIAANMFIILGEANKANPPHEQPTP